MTPANPHDLIHSLAAGFESLQVEYRKLHGQHQALERKLVAAREQYKDLAKLCNTSTTLSTPPLSLSSSTKQHESAAAASPTTAELLEQHTDKDSQDAARNVREATLALTEFKQCPEPGPNNGSGVKIWSGRSADDTRPSHTLMPAVHESPLEQDFTIEGVPSKLGCPFASMANKKLSSHAASVLSRYNHGSQGGGGTSISAASRINGRESFARRSSQRASFADPIQADIPDPVGQDRESPHSERIASDAVVEKPEETDVGMCPIRFLDQHSPEEVATYFEKHKHELPRSHEICVKRYQSNEQQIAQLDAKYGNLVTMIQGLGAKHQSFLPKEHEEELAGVAETAASAEKVRKWADSVSAQAADGNEVEHDEGDEERLPHFERPLRDIRVGESPSRPWGISVPPKYLERQVSLTSSKPAAVPPEVAGAAAVPPTRHPDESKVLDPQQGEQSQPKCPFNFGAQPKKFPPSLPKATSQQQAEPDVDLKAKPDPLHGPADLLSDGRVVFKGPVFFGYSAEDAAKILHHNK